MKPFFTIKFSQKGHNIVIDTYLKQKDKDGYFLTTVQKHGVEILLYKVLETLDKNDLESLK